MECVVAGVNNVWSRRPAWHQATSHIFQIIHFYWGRKWRPFLMTAEGGWTGHHGWRKAIIYDGSGCHFTAALQPPGDHASTMCYTNSNIHWFKLSSRHKVVQKANIGSSDTRQQAGASCQCWDDVLILHVSGHLCKQLGKASIKKVSQFVWPGGHHSSY